jgi:hypothetical protein
MTGSATPFQTDSVATSPADSGPTVRTNSPHLPAKGGGHLQLARDRALVVNEGGCLDVFLDELQIDKGTGR